MWPLAWNRAEGQRAALGPVEEEDVVGAGQSLQQDLLLRDGLGRVELHPDELPHVLVHQADAGAVDDVSDVGRDPVNTHARGGVTAAATGRGNKQPQTGAARLQDQSGGRQEAVPTPHVTTVMSPPAEDTHPRKKLPV